MTYEQRVHDPNAEDIAYEADRQERLDAKQQYPNHSYTCTECEKEFFLHDSIDRGTGIKNSYEFCSPSCYRRWLGGNEEA